MLYRGAGLGVGGTGAYGAFSLFKRKKKSPGLFISGPLRLSTIRLPSHGPFPSSLVKRFQIIKAPFHLI